MVPGLQPLRAAAFALALTCLAIGVRAEDPPVPEAPPAISFSKDVLPLLQQHCQGCHQPAKKGGNLLTTAYGDLLKAGDTGQPAIVPGAPDDSELYLQLLPQRDKPPKMPKGREPLKPFEIEKIKAWIAAGAIDDTPPSTAPAIDAAHPPVYTQAPVITSIEFSPDGKLLAVAGYHEVLLYEAAPDPSAPAGFTWSIAARLVGMADRIEALAFSPDGTRLVAVGGTQARFGEAQMWDVAERKLVWSIAMTYDNLYGASWSPDGKLVAFGCGDNTFRAVTAEAGKQVLFQGAHNDWVLDTVFSTDSSHLVSVSRDRSMKLTEVATERFEDNITSITPGALKGGLMTVDRHPQRDELLVGGADGAPKLYRMYREKARVIGDDFNLIRAYEALPGRVFAVDFSRDGARLAAASSADGLGEARIYQTDDAKLVSKLEGQRGPVYTISLHPEGKLVASAGFDGLVRINDVETGKLLVEFPGVPLTQQPLAAAP